MVEVDKGADFFWNLALLGDGFGFIVPAHGLADEVNFGVGKWGEEFLGPDGEFLTGDVFAFKSVFFLGSDGALWKFDALVTKTQGDFLIRKATPAGVVIYEGGGNDALVELLAGEALVFGKQGVKILKAGGDMNVGGAHAQVGEGVFEHGAVFFGNAAQHVVFPGNFYEKVSIFWGEAASAVRELETEILGKGI